MYKTTIQLNHYFATLQHLRFHGLSQDQQEKKSKPNKNKKHIGVTNLKHSWTDNYYVAVVILAHGKHICFSSSERIRKYV